MPLSQDTSVTGRLCQRCCEHGGHTDKVKGSARVDPLAEEGGRVAGPAENHLGVLKRR